MYAKALIGRDAYKVSYVSDKNASQAASAAALFGAEAVSLEVLAEQAQALLVLGAAEVREPGGAHRGRGDHGVSGDGDGARAHRRTTHTPVSSHTT